MPSGCANNDIHIYASYCSVVSPQAQIVTLIYIAVVLESKSVCLYSLLQVVGYCDCCKKQNPSNLFSGLCSTKNSLFTFT